MRSASSPAAETSHVPVLRKEVCELLNPAPKGVVFDGTVGTGGHAEALLLSSGPSGRLIGCDLDDDALSEARIRLASFGSRVLLVKGSYADAPQIFADHPDFSPVTSILLDLGVSSLELEKSGRGFSFRRADEALDMRFDPSSGSPTAAALLASMPEHELADLLHRFGEEPLARRIAHAIVLRRADAPMRTVRELTACVLSAYGKRGYHVRSRVHPATRTFQALRIAVNHEIETLERALPQLMKVLEARGRIAVISFHSLEDRIVKHFFRDEARGCICPAEIPECRCGHAPTLHIVTKHPILPSNEEQKNNPRSRSAKLRVAEKLSS